MKKHPFLQGVGLGMVAGSVLGMMAAPKKKSMKRTAEKMVRNLGEAVENLSDTMGL